MSCSKALLQFSCTSAHIWPQIQRGEVDQYCAGEKCVPAVAQERGDRGKSSFLLEKVHVEELLETVFQSVRIPCCFVDL